MEQSAPYADRKIDRVRSNSGTSEGQRHWDRDDPRMSNQWPPHQYTEGQGGGNATRSQSHGQMSLPNTGEKGIEQDMELGYEDKPSQLTLETLEKKFSDEIMKLAKEESDAEAEENTRHRERKMEISNQYHEKLSALRALQAKQREEFMYKETQERLKQYQQQQQQQQLVPNNYATDRASLDPHGYGPHHYPTDTSRVDHRGYGPNYYPTDTIPADPRGYGGPAIVEPRHRGYSNGPYEPYRQRSPYSEVHRNQQEAERKVPTPQGRAYNNTRARNL